MAMSPELKVKWVEALRSGKYDQTKASLKSSGRYCCLGVLCDLVDPKGWGGCTAAGDVRYKGHLSYIPDEVRTSIGLTNTLMYDAAEMNDRGKTFPEIADWIEANL